MARRDRPDHWALKAKKAGYPARSVYKLEEIQKKWAPLRRNRPVLDIGAAPGSWTLYALRNLGPSGRVVAVDLKDLAVTAPPSTELRFFRGDVFGEDAAAFLETSGPFGCVLSDAAPSTTGQRLVDARRSYDLVMRVLDLAESHLETGGNLVVKVFQGGDEQDIRRRLQDRYESVRTFKPKAVRSDSFEIYMIGLGHRPA